MKYAITILMLYCSTLSKAQMREISVETLQDKIRGGWAGQTIGVTYGGPYEFQYNGTFIQDYVPLVWRKGYVREWMINVPGLFDDLYMDLSFVEVMEKYGLDAPIDSFAHSFARAQYPLWHANQSARYNIQQGLHPPATGHWKNNPHADDIDYQIEADFSGLMCPGMPKRAASIGDKIGHIMNYGDGWYGGIFVGTMYTQAFFSSDIHFIVRESLKSIPTETRFHQCISDVLNWHDKYPGDWHRTWFELQKKWTSEIGCPDGIFNAFNIDATINAAYVVLGLLYGKGDFGKSIEISTRAGQDADCNPSTVAGVLGTMIGYSKIPEYWKQGLDSAENIPFKYTSMSLNDVYRVGLKHALAVIQQEGGSIAGNIVKIRTQAVTPVRREQSFEGLSSVHTLQLPANSENTSFTFDGAAVVVKGYAMKSGQDLPDKVLALKVTIDDDLVDTVYMPTDQLKRSNDVYWNYDLKQQEHKIIIERLYPDPRYQTRITSGFYYRKEKN